MYSNLKLGYLLYRPKGFVEHVGVYLGSGQVLHNSPSGNVEVVTYQEYAAEETVKIVTTSQHNVEDLAERLNSLLAADSRYCPVSNNCEHIAYYLIYGRRFSPQIQATLSASIVAAFLSWKMKRGNPLVVGAIGGIVGCILSNLNRKYDCKLATG